MKPTRMQLMERSLIKRKMYIESGAGCNAIGDLAEIDAALAARDDSSGAPGLTTVYALFHTYKKDHDELLGIYSSPEAAWYAYSKYSQEYAVIKEYTVDAKCINADEVAIWFRGAK